MSNDLMEWAATFGIILDDKSLTHLTFGKEFAEAVEAKQVAQQEAASTRFVVEKAEQQKKASHHLCWGWFQGSQADRQLTGHHREQPDRAAQAGSCRGHHVPALILWEHHLPSSGAVHAPPAAPEGPPCLHFHGPTAPQPWWFLTLSSFCPHPRNHCEISWLA